MNNPVTGGSASGSTAARALLPHQCLAGSAHPARRSPHLLAAMLVSSLVAAGTGYARTPADEAASLDGLVPLEGARVDVAYIHPEADFSIYERIMLVEPEVAFRRNWQRDQNRSRRTGDRISSSDMERIKADVAALLSEVFIEVLQEKDGYRIVTEADDDVLLVRPVILDLDVSAPDTMRSPGRSVTYTTTAGSATLYLEVFDSVTGDILGRAADRRQARNLGGSLNWTTSNRVTNRAEAKRLFRQWATQLRNFLDSYYTPDTPDTP